MKHIHNYTVGELIKMGMNVEVDYKSADSLVFKQPLTKDELESEDWYCLDVGLSVRDALNSLGVGVECADSWQMYGWEVYGAVSVCVIYDSVDSKAFTGFPAHLKTYRDNGAKEVVMINNKFYWKD